MEKGIVGVTPGGNGSYNVTYDIEVKNIGGADGNYTLLDEAMFDDDVIINGERELCTRKSTILFLSLACEDLMKVKQMSR